MDENDLKSNSADLLTLEATSEPAFNVINELLGAAWLFSTAIWVKISVTHALQGSGT